MEKQSQSNPVTVESERVDDIPLLLGLIMKLGLPALLDKCLPTHGNWTGLSIGWLLTIWLSYILTEHDHRMNHVQDWVNKRTAVIQTVTGQQLRNTDFTDDRLAQALRYLSDTQDWQEVETQIAQQSIRVYQLPTETVRLDASVYQTSHHPDKSDLFKKGRTKSGSYDTQFKMMLGALDPLGLPLAVELVAGNQSDDPLYLPVWQRVHDILDKSGLLYVGDCKMAALLTRATIAKAGDYYLMPLPMNPTNKELLDQQIDRYLTGQVQAQEIRPAAENLADLAENSSSNLVDMHSKDLPPITLDEQIDTIAGGEIDKSYQDQPTESNLNQRGGKLEDLPPNQTNVKPDPQVEENAPIAIAFESVVNLEQEFEIEGQEQKEKFSWQERLVIVRSTSYQRAQEESFAKRLDRAEAALRALTPEPGRGRRQKKEEAALRQAAEEILAKYRVSEYFDLSYERQEKKRHIRGYKGKADRIETKVRYQIHVERKEEAIIRATKRLGWRLYSTNAPQERLSINEVVLSYRRQIVIEDKFSRLNKMNLTPLYVQRDDHAIGLVRLLTVALTIQVLMEFAIKRKLAEEKRKLSGIYAGQPNRSTARPSAERILYAFGGITLTLIGLTNQIQIAHLTALTTTQRQILRLLDLPESLYTQLADLKINSSSVLLGEQIVTILPTKEYFSATASA